MDGVRSEKISDVLLSKGAEMTLEKAINVCRTNEITKLQTKEMSSDKEVNGISKKKLQKASKPKKRVRESDKVVKSDQKNELNRINDEKRCKFCGRIPNQENILHMGRNVVNIRKKSFGNYCYTQKVHEIPAPLDDFVLKRLQQLKRRKQMKYL